MQNDRAKFKNEFKRRVYRFALDVIEFVDQLPAGQTSRIIGDQLLRSTTSIGANVIEAQAASSRKLYAKSWWSFMEEGYGWRARKARALPSAFLCL